MHNIICKLVLFRPEEDSILRKLSQALREVGDGAPTSALLDEISLQFRRMVDLADELSMEGNLWHNYLAWFLLTAENPFTLRREYASDRVDTLASLAKKDMALLRELFRYDLRSIGQNLLGVDYFDDLYMIGGSQKAKGIVGALVSETAQKLAAAPSVEAFYNLLVTHYANHGVGVFGIYKRKDENYGIIESE